MLSFIVLVLISYVVGSIPSSVWVGKVTKGIDLREHGSGNAGATNTFRVLGWKAGVFVVIIDFIKGLTATLWVMKLAPYFGELPQWFMDGNESVLKIILGFTAVIGHTLPIFAQFRGGKGMLTACGMLFGVEPISIGIATTTFLVVMFSSRYVSLASIISSIVYPIMLLILKFGFGMNISYVLIVLATLLCVFLIYKHRSNITRLKAGNENKIPAFWKKSEK
ncbi:glycerol-3-phosphate 1-O-acyltransferase [bacterium]|nr:MAG: glycerol-3-phosphate 1-O-acyltransferase [bacterium]